MNKVDLHVHSTASDGTFTPAELVRAAVKAELSSFALTDHDTVAGINEALKTAHGVIEVIPGIEISTSWKDKEIHIVGLCIDYNDNDFLKAIGNEVSRRNERNLKLIDMFNEYGFPVTLEELTDMFPDSIITRAHFASYMVKKGMSKITAKPLQNTWAMECLSMSQGNVKAPVRQLILLKKQREPPFSPILCYIT